MQPPVAAGAARRTDHRAVDQRQVQRSIAKRQPAPLFQQAAQQVLQPIAHLAQPAEHALVAQPDNGRIACECRRAAQRQVPGPIHQRQAQKVLGTTNLANPPQRTKRPRRRLKIGNFAKTRHDR